MPALDLLVIDEAHHAVADSYRRIIDRARSANPDCRIFGVTATPNRGDRKGLREIFDNVGDQVRLGELIASGHLVPPRTFIIDVGVQDRVARGPQDRCSDFDMSEVAGIMNRAPVTDEVIRHWREKASDRPTVVFCSTVAHAENVAAAFNDADIAAAVIHGDSGRDVPAQDPGRLCLGRNPRHRQRRRANGRLGPSADLLCRAAATRRPTNPP